MEGEPGPLEEHLQNLTFTHDPQADTLTDSFQSVWTREGADPPTTPLPLDTETTDTARRPPVDLQGAGRERPVRPPPRGDRSGSGERRGAEALMMDVEVAAGANVCHEVMTRGSDRAPLVVGNIGLVSGDRMRLYLFDMPDGSSMRILAIAIIAPESRFASLTEAAGPVVDSVEFHAP